MKETSTQKYLGMFLDFRLDFQEHWKSLLKKVNKTVALLNKFQNILPRSALLTTYKCFVRSHLDYGDIIYDQAFSDSFHQNIESLQYNAALAITDAIEERRGKKVYQELGLEFLLTLLSKIRNINLNILENTNSQITRFLLYGDNNVTASTNFIILSSTMEYILATKRLDEPLFH